MEAEYNMEFGATQAEDPNQFDDVPKDLGAASREERPLSGKSGTIFFVMIILVAATEGVAICSPLFDLPPDSQQLLVKLFIVFLGFTWLAFASARHNRELLQVLFVCACFGIPIVGMILFEIDWLFWVCITTLIISTSLYMDFELTFMRCLGKHTYFRLVVLPAAYANWVVIGIVVTIGNTGFLSYSKPAISITTLHFLLDIRYLVTGFFILFVFGDAVFKAAQADKPNIPKIPDLRIPHQISSRRSLVDYLIEPFILLLNIPILTLQKLAGIIWEFVASIFYYLSVIGSNLAKRLIEIVTNNDVWRVILRILSTFTAFLSFAIAVKNTSTKAISYLQIRSSLNALSEEVLWAFASLAALFFATYAGILFLFWLWDIRPEPYQAQALFGGAMILVILFLAGSIIYLLASFAPLQISGFESLGIYTLAILGTLGGVLVYQLSRLALKRFP